MGALFSKYSRKRKSKRKKSDSTDPQKEKQRNNMEEKQSPVSQITPKSRKASLVSQITPKSRKASVLLRVGSPREPREQLNITSSNSGDDDLVQFNRGRASTYSNVRDAVMHNLSGVERSKHDQSVPMGVIGLRNLGNTCFINSSLQCLSATIPLTDYFLGYDYRSEINKDNFLGTGGKLVSAYAELMKKMWLGSKSTVEPIDFKEQLGTFAPQFNGYRQHDSQELLAFLLDGIHEDLNRVMNKPYVEDGDCDGKTDENDAMDSWMNYLRRNKSLVVDLFQGQLRNTCSCLTCGHKNIRFDPFMYLSLPINKNCRSIEECMNIYLEEEILKGANQWYCGKCEKHVDATKKTDLWILPPILIVHLKRFRYNDSGNMGSKNEASIEYPVAQWDLKSRVKSTGSACSMYDLYAVSNHVGSLGGGHYTALALNRFDDAWYEFNDSSYHCVDETIHKSHKKSAYVLFYNRSEGDASMPLNERAPLIRRQSVSRPDLWPHTQVDDPRKVRGYTRSRISSIDQTELKSPTSPSRLSRASRLLAKGDIPVPLSSGSLGEKKRSTHSKSSRSSRSSTSQSRDRDRSSRSTRDLDRSTRSTGSRSPVLLVDRSSSPSSRNDESSRRRKRRNRDREREMDR